MAAKCCSSAAIEGRVGLGGEVVGEVERAGGQGGHGISSDLRGVTLERKFGAHERSLFLLHMRGEEADRVVRGSSPRPAASSASPSTRRCQAGPSGWVRS